MGEVVILDCSTTLDIPTDRVLNAACGELELVLLLGYDNNGNDYFASSSSDNTKLLWLIERFKQKLITGTLAEE